MIPGTIRFDCDIRGLLEVLQQAVSSIELPDKKRI